ncbi:MAG TPA: RagB/SusD family nutrient uptake outer membrane protein [Cyclobacteriaceae bacterium]|nr:RagB/SusD family nutrient uptake outer membrane protein [Cyclobacteriaceae bacterium]
MKNFKIKIKASAFVFAAVLSMGVFSCKTELLDAVPKNAIADIQAFDTPDRITLQVNNLYTAVKNGNFLGGRAQIYGDVRANDFLNRTTNGVTGYLVWQHTINEASQNDVINMWTFAYAAINQINVFLDGMEANKEKLVAPVFAANYQTTTAQNYIAEARFLRAVSYHYLLQFYARPFVDQNGGRPGLVLRLKGEKGLENNELARSTVAETYAQIISDLDFAEANLPDTYGDALTRITRAHKNTAIAFKTRVYLTMGDYAKVITEANKLVPDVAPFTAKVRVAHTLQANVADVFAVPQETSESIFSMPFSAQNTPGGQNQLGFYYRASAGTNIGGGEFSLNQGAGSIVADNTNFPATDARRTAFVYTQGTERYLGKYPSGTPYLDKAPVIRWAEVLLNLSEAIARTTSGVDPKALSLVNAVRTRSTGATGALAPASNAALISGIMTERRIEFLGEGLRNQDIMRLQGTFPGKGAVPAVDPTNAVWVWPIPVTERQANTACVPN